MPLFLYEVALTSIRLKYRWFVQPSFRHPLPCHVLFQDCWGDYMVVYLDVFQYSTSKGLRRNILFLYPLLVPLPCSLEGSKCRIHKPLACLFLRICWIFPTFAFKLVERIDYRRLYDFLPCPCSFAMSFWLFPPQHLTFSVIQQVFNQQPCHPYMFVSCFALHGLRQKHCYLQEPLQRLMALFL